MKINIFLAFIACLAIIAMAKFVSAQDDATFRLPANTRPMHYRIELTTDIDRGDFDFSGVVNIRFQALVNTSEIILHSRQLTIQNINLFYAGNASAILIEPNITHTQDELREFLIIPTAQELEIYEQYIVEIAYSGVLRTDNFGFYRSSYRDPDGNIHWHATTHLQPTDPRHAFPCYDEPGIRARFSIEITHNANYSAFSNMPVRVINSVPDSPYITTIFEETPLIQTYIIAFIVSDFETHGNQDPMPQRVIAKPESIALGEANLALDAGERILASMEDYLNMTYNLPKLDQVAVPDFPWAAMENWGMCLYREEILLFNEELGTLRQRDTVVTVVSHEYIVSTGRHRNFCVEYTF